MLVGYIGPLPAEEDVFEERNRRITLAVRREVVVPQVGIALLTVDGHIAAIGRLQRGPLITTLDRRMKLDFVEWFAPLSLAELLLSLDKKLQHHLRRMITVPGQLAPHTWMGVRETIRRLRQDMADHIDYIEQRTHDRRERSGSSSTPNLLFEKDAAGLALSLAGLDTQWLQAYRPLSAPAPFLAGLSEAVLSEDQVIQHDLGVFGDWKAIQSYVVGAVQFSDGKNHVTVVNVNRTSVERSLGVDLVYYNRNYHSFVLVQYKKFSSEKGLSGNKGVWEYRPSRDRNLEPEIRRMELANGLVGAQSASPSDYRLHSGPCYIKICEPNMDLFSTKLASGMYLSLDYFKLILESDMCKGPRGGRVIPHQTVDRYLTNTEFVQLVKSGWIGSYGQVSTEIERYVQAGLRGDRSLLLAVGERTQRRLGG